MPRVGPLPTSGNCRRGVRAGTGPPGPPPPGTGVGAVRYAVATAANRAAETASDGHPHWGRIDRLRGAVNRTVLRVKDLRWRGADCQADEAADAVGRLQTDTEAEVDRLTREVRADAAAASTRAEAEERAAQAALVRCVAGNPFREARFDPAWRTSTAVGLAWGMYEARDFGALPILADALEDAGCDAAAILAHCRGGGPHARGCWVVDRVTVAGDLAPLG